MAMGWPAISIVAFRGAPAFGANPTVITPVPVMLAPGFTNESVAKTWYGQPDCVTTRIGRLVAVPGADVDERLVSYVHPLTAGMLSWLSMNRVPKYFTLPKDRVKNAPPIPAFAGSWPPIAL